MGARGVRVNVYGHVCGGPTLANRVAARRLDQQQVGFFLFFFV
jgi:hypothetical protein